jgi:hypothetical protein
MKLGLDSREGVATFGYMWDDVERRMSDNQGDREYHLFNTVAGFMKFIQKHKTALCLT